MPRLFLLFLFAGLVLVQAELPPMVFNCSDGLADLCTHMCWGAYCTQPAFGAVLTYDNYQGKGGDSSVAKARRKSAGCLPSPNRCSTLGGDTVSGQNCDEYPFASTSDSDAGGQTSRCVVAGHNSRQGGIISSYNQENCDTVPCEFQITFGNPDATNVSFCNAYTNRASLCINDVDPPIFKNGKPDVNYASRKRSENDVEINSALFLLESGMRVVMPIDTLLNSSVVHPRPHNSTLKTWVEENDEDEALIQWRFEEDFVVSRLD